MFASLGKRIYKVDQVLKTNLINCFISKTLHTTQKLFIPAMTDLTTTLDIERDLEQKLLGHPSPSHFHLVEEALCEYIFPGFRESPSGTPYTNGRFLDTKKGNHGIFLICSTAWDLNLVQFLEGQLVRFDIREDGLRLKPLAKQPKETQLHIVNCLEVGDAAPPSEELDKDSIEDVPCAHVIEETTTDFLDKSAYQIEKIFNSAATKVAELNLSALFCVVLPNQALKNQKRNK